MSEVIGRKMVKTRKSHVCFGCGRELPPGSRMESRFVVDGKPWSCYLCQTCLPVESELYPTWNEYCFGELRERALAIEATEKIAPCCGCS